jgi:zinc protease
MTHRCPSIAAPLALALALVPRLGAAQPTSPPAPPPAVPGAMGKLPTLEQASLDNGLRIAVLRTTAAPVVSVQLWYRAGSKDEPRDRRGSAHMFEHMMFKGSQRVRAEAHAQLLNGLGGYVNAQTEEDSSHYINTLPAAYLDFAIQLEAERMRGLLFRPEMIAREREVVKEELRQQDNAPLAKGFLRFLRAAFT